MLALLQAASSYWPAIIGVFVVINCVVWWWLRRTAGHIKQDLGDHLGHLVSDSAAWGFKSTRDTLDDRIDIFVTNINDRLKNYRTKEEVIEICNELTMKDQSWTRLKTDNFERAYSVFRTMPEIYPLLGIVGTVLAIAAGLQGESADKIDLVVKNFGNSVWSTAIGLMAAIVFMVVNALQEPSFERVLTYKQQVREIITLAKQVLLGVPKREAVHE
jgi:biopolymer transport protein ExbB